MPGERTRIGLAKGTSENQKSKLGLNTMVFQVRFSLTSLPSIALFSCSPFPRFPQRELIQDKTACGKASQKKTEVIISEVPCDWRFQFLPKAKGTSASRS